VTDADHRAHGVGAGRHVVEAAKDLRVCHIMSADLWAGAEVQVATVASYLVEQPRVKLSAVLLNEGRLARELRGLGVPVTVVDETQHSAMWILAFLVRFLRANGPDIVHTHRYKDTVLGTIAAKLAGVRHVIRTVHGLSEPIRGWDWAKFQVYEALDRATLWCFADRIIAVSRHMAESLKESGYRRTAITQIYNGIALGKVRATRIPEEVRREFGIGARTFLIGAVGRLSPVKGHAYLVRAVRRIRQREPDTRCLIVGSGPLKDELLASARDLRVDDACLFVGPRADIYDLIAAMDIVVLPSLDEGTPMALLEAMALAKPVVATAVGGVPEIIAHRATGVLVKPRDEEALADACLELAIHRDWAQTLGARARRLIEAEFSHEKTGRALVDVYRNVAVGQKAHEAGAKEVAPRSRWRFGSVRKALTRWWGGTRRSLGYLWRRLDHAVERQRMNRMRRYPTAVATAMKSARSILIVCYGNIIRSAFAARLVGDAAGPRRLVSISSAGLGAIPGQRPHPTAVLTATRMGVDLGHHTAALLTPEDVANADVIFVMEIAQLVALRQRFPEARAKTFLLTCLAPEVPLEVRDPVDGDDAEFQACFDHISRAVRPMARLLSDGASR
jgi:glycosyltransferase involved in cell wall biosynthesis/protein-tyrosine-phosphatase